jgi:hypothetical protein
MGQCQVERPCGKNMGIWKFIDDRKEMQEGDEMMGN